MSNFKILKAPYQAKRDLDSLVAYIDGKDTGSLEDFYLQLGKGLRFPSHFGKNLDGLFDCLCDFSWLDASKIHIILQNYDEFLAKEPKNKRWDVLVVLNDAANEWKATKGAERVRLEIYVEPSERIKQDLDDAEI
jgi:RNAse (barnase) inhibitor barstar